MKEIFPKSLFESNRIQRKEKLTEIEADWVRKIIDSTKLPKTNLKKINKLENPHGLEEVMATWQPWNGELTLFKNLNKLPRIAQMGTIAHELGGHGASPLDANNDRIYGSNTNREKAKQTAVQTATQSLEYKVFMTPYHKMLAGQFLQKKIDGVRYVEEVNAIRTQLIYENPNHLKQVAEAQLKAAQMKGKKGLDIFDAAEENVLFIVPGFEGDKELMRGQISEYRRALIREDKQISECGRTAPKILKHLAPAMMVM